MIRRNSRWSVLLGFQGGNYQVFSGIVGVNYEIKAAADMYVHGTATISLIFLNRHLLSGTSLIDFVNC